MFEMSVMVPFPSEQEAARGARDFGGWRRRRTEDKGQLVF
jgi:hypothetical protein